MAIEDAVRAGRLIELASGDYAKAFQRYQTLRAARTARITLESRAIWEVYHAEDLAREAMWQQLSERTETDSYQCLAWIYDGVALPKSV